MKYVVRVTETLVKHIVVEADSESKAEDKVFSAHYNGKITLDYNDYDDVNCDCIREAEEDDIADYIDVEDL